MLEILTGTLAPWEVPSGFQEVELDLGCGKGGFLLALARKYPEKLIVGADVMLGRLRKVAKKASREHLENVRLLRVSAWDLIGHHLPDHSIARVHILCPDPWPKSRHRSKRLLTSEFFGRLATKITRCGTLHFATDDTDYFTFARDAVTPLSCYTPAMNSIHDVRMIKTDFEAGFEEQGITVEHLAFRCENK